MPNLILSFCFMLAFCACNSSSKKGDVQSMKEMGSIYVADDIGINELLVGQEFLISVKFPRDTSKIYKDFYNFQVEYDPKILKLVSQEKVEDTRPCTHQVSAFKISPEVLIAGLNGASQPVCSNFYIARFQVIAQGYTDVFLINNPEKLVKSDPKISATVNKYSPNMLKRIYHFQFADNTEQAKK